MNQRYYDTTLEPMQMLQAYRSGQPVINHVWRPAQQFLPQGLPSYVPPMPLNPAAMLGQLQQDPNRLPQSITGGPGGDGAPGGVGTDGGADGSGGAGGGGGK